MAKQTYTRDEVLDMLYEIKIYAGSVLADAEYKRNVAIDSDDKDWLHDYNYNCGKCESAARIDGYLRGTIEFIERDKD